MKWWTAETLRSYLESEIDSLRRENDLRHQASDTAISKAEQANETRFHSLNEFRGVLSDQAGTFMPRTEAIARADHNLERIDALSVRVSDLEGQRKGALSTTTLFLTLGGLILTVVSILITVLVLK